jgi:hypothetical protein
MSVVFGAPRLTEGPLCDTALPARAAVAARYRRSAVRLAATTTGRIVWRRDQPQHVLRGRPQREAVCLTISPLFSVQVDMPRLERLCSSENRIDEARVPAKAVEVGIWPELKVEPRSEAVPDAEVQTEPVRRRCPSGDAECRFGFEADVAEHDLRLGSDEIRCAAAPRGLRVVRSTVS